LNPEGQIALGQPTIGDAELAAVADVFRSGWLSGAGPTCRRFEERFSALAGTETRSRRTTAARRCTLR
jgi:perosamine synthetase